MRRAVPGVTRLAAMAALVVVGCGDDGGGSESSSGASSGSGSAAGGSAAGGGGAATASSSSAGGMASSGGSSSSGSCLTCDLAIEDLVPHAGTLCDAMAESLYAAVVDCYCSACAACAASEYCTAGGPAADAACTDCAIDVTENDGCATPISACVAHDG